jgi:hypothetical protein
MYTQIADSIVLFTFKWSTKGTTTDQQTQVSLASVEFTLTGREVIFTAINKVL